MSTTDDDLRALLDEWKTLARRATAPTPPAVVPRELVAARAAAQRFAARTVPRLIGAVEAVLDVERMPAADEWALGYNAALEDVVGAIHAALIGES